MTETLSLLQSLELCVALTCAFGIKGLRQSPFFTLGSVSKAWVLSGGNNKIPAYQTFSENSVEG